MDKQLQAGLFPGATPDERQRARRQLRLWRDSGWSFAEIAEELRARGITNRRGAPLRAETVRVRYRALQCAGKDLDGIQAGTYLGNQMRGTGAFRQ